MQNATNETLTADEMRAIDAMSPEKAMAYVHYCAYEKLSLVSVDEYISVLGGKRRKTYLDAKAGQKLKLELSGHIFLAINDK